MQEKDLFLCHSGVDKDWVEALGEDIEAEEWNGRHLSVFLDKWDIEGGGNIMLHLNEALATARFVAVVMTPEMLTSEWCKAEWSSVLHNDPTNRRGRILPIRLRDVHLSDGSRITVPPFLGSLAYFDFRTRRNYRNETERLLAKLRGEAPPRGRGRARRHRTSESASRLVPALPSAREDADRVTETLISNLLPVRALPTLVWSAATAVQTKRDLPNGLPPAIIREGRLYTFANLGAEQHPFVDHVRAGTAARTASVEWMPKPSRWRWYIELLNDTLRSQLAAADIHFDASHQRFYFAALGTGTRRLQWGSGTRRWVVREPDPGKGGYWLHHAARLRFETLDEKVYLSIEPTMMFTKDGRVPVSKELAGPLAMKWTGKERNGTILRHVLMWSDALTSGRREAVIPAGDQRLVLGRLPTTVRVSMGIARDHVKIGALLEFSKAELDPDAAQNLFAYIDGAAEASEGPVDAATEESS